MSIPEQVDLRETRTGWRLEAACSGLDTNLFFPSTEDDQVQLAFTRQVCASCPVQQACLAYAIESRQTVGIWGGATTRERRRLRRRWLEHARRVS
ncbi:MAG: WhiB family transcriptional regulator [Acidimicrobiia bacterium]|nr:WhiB family transcriptional regulator [Acidimicrobiia bacterium]MDH3398413.1 WhiB family transcriptional regulator [Acidimicrobiia bacterium]